MVIDVRKYGTSHADMLRDNRSLWMRIGDNLSAPYTSGMLFFVFGLSIHFLPELIRLTDIILLVGLLYFLWP